MIFLHIFFPRVKCLLPVDIWFRESQSGNGYRSIGSLLNTNTIDQFKTCDKQNILKDAGNKVCTL